MKRRSDRVLGGNVKRRVLSADTIYAFDGKTHIKAKIKYAVENPANRNFARMNILTKGAIVDTDKGKIRITSRPGQCGSLCGVLVK